MKNETCLLEEIQKFFLNLSLSELSNVWPKTTREETFVILQYKLFPFTLPTTTPYHKENHIPLTGKPEGLDLSDIPGFIHFQPFNLSGSVEELHLPI